MLIFINFLLCRFSSSSFCLNHRKQGWIDWEKVNYKGTVIELRFLKLFGSQWDAKFIKCQWLKRQRMLKLIRNCRASRRLKKRWSFKLFQSNLLTFMEKPWVSKSKKLYELLSWTKLSKSPEACQQHLLETQTCSKFLFLSLNSF